MLIYDQISFTIHTRAENASQPIDLLHLNFWQAYCSRSVKSASIVRSLTLDVRVITIL